MQLYLINSVNFALYGDERDQGILEKQFAQIPETAQGIDASNLGLVRYPLPLVRQAFARVSSKVTSLILSDRLPSYPDHLGAILTALPAGLNALYLRADVFGLASVPAFQAFPKQIKSFQLSFYVLTEETISALSSILAAVTPQLDILYLKNLSGASDSGTYDTYPGIQPRLFDLPLADFRKLFSAISPETKQVELDMIPIDPRTDVADLCDKIDCLPLSVKSLTFKSSDPSKKPFVLNRSISRQDLEFILTCYKMGVGSAPQESGDGRLYLPSPHGLFPTLKAAPPVSAAALALEPVAGPAQTRMPDAVFASAPYAELVLKMAIAPIIGEVNPPKEAIALAQAVALIAAQVAAQDPAEIVQAPKEEGDSSEQASSIAPATP